MIQTILIYQRQDIDALPLKDRYAQRTVPGKLANMPELLDNDIETFFDKVLHQHTADLVVSMGRHWGYEFKGSFTGIVGAFNRDVQVCLVFQRIP